MLLFSGFPFKNSQVTQRIDCIDAWRRIAAGARSFALVSGTGLLLLTCPMTSATEPLLLPASPWQMSAPLKPEGIERRVQRAHLNPRALARGLDQRSLPMDRVALNFFPGIDASGVFVSTETMGSGHWVGHGLIEGRPHSHFLVSVKGDGFAASAYLPGQGRYRVMGTLTDGLRVSELKAEGSDCALCSGATHADAAFSGVSTASLALDSLAPQVGPGTAAVAIVDLLVVFTPSARAGAGGMDAMNALVEVAVAEANTVYQNSQANVRLRLVKTSEVVYQEAASHSVNLNRLRLTTDGFLDDVHALRETNRADLVCLITESGDPGFSGLSLIMPEASAVSKPFGFCVVKRSDALGGFVLVHEVSHNFGCQHDRDNAYDSEGRFIPGVFHYAYGHRFTFGNTLYRTVMAYKPGEIVPFLSNPNLLFGEVALGIPSSQTNIAADNVLTLNWTAPIVSGYYGPPTQTLPPLVNWVSPAEGAVFTEGEPIALRLQATDPDGVVLQAEVYYNAGLVGIVERPASSTVDLAWTEAPPGRHQLVARAVDHLGASAAALPLALTVRPRNDAFGARLALPTAPATVAGSNRAATLEPNEPSPAGNQGAQSVWYSWTAPAMGSVFLTVTGDGFVPLPGVYRGVNLASLRSEALSIDFDLPANTARLGFDAVPGQVYHIAIASQPSHEGPFTLRLDYQTAPPNDDFANRLVLTGDAVRIEASNIGATSEPGEPPHSSYAGGKSLWYQWTAPRTGVVRLACSSAQFIFLLDVYQGAQLTALTHPATRAIEFDAARRLTTLTFTAVAGTTYVIAVDGYEGFAAPFEFTLDYLAAPANDDFERRTGLRGTRVSFTASNAAATSQPGEPNHANTPGGKSLWYTWLAPVTGPVTVTITDASPLFIALPDAYQGTVLASLQRVARSISVSTNDISQVIFDAVLGQPYELAVDSYGGVGGDFTFLLETQNQPAAAEAASATARPDGSFRFSVEGTTGQRFRLQTTTNLADWAELLSGALGAGKFELIHTNRFSDPARFYRVIPQP